MAILILRVNPNRTRLTLLELKEKCFVSEIHSSSLFNLIWIKKYFYAAKIKPSVVALSVFLKRVFGYKDILGINVLDKYYFTKIRQSQSKARWSRWPTCLPLQWACKQSWSTGKQQTETSKRTLNKNWIGEVLVFFTSGNQTVPFFGTIAKLRLLWKYDYTDL